jgi:hypothetical protein
MPISDYASHSPGVETPGYRLKPVETGSGVDARFVISAADRGSHIPRTQCQTHFPSNRSPPTPLLPLKSSEQRHPPLRLCLPIGLNL